MAEKPDEVNAWLDDENGNRAADLILKPDDYTETVKLPGKKPGWMQRKHTYSAGGEELEGWEGPEVLENGNVSELYYDSGLLTIIISIPYDIINQYYSRRGPDGYIDAVNNDVNTMKNINLAGAYRNDTSIWKQASMNYISIRKNDTDERVEETYEMSSDAWYEMSSSFFNISAYLAMASWISQDDISLVHCSLTNLHTIIYKISGQTFTSTFDDELQISIDVDGIRYNGVAVSFSEYENINHLKLIFN